jgi:D-alanyl-D-alanine carboxypeptidase
VQLGIRSLLASFLAIVVAVAAAAPAAARSGREASSDPVQKALDRVAAAGAPGALALVAGPRGARTWAAGYARLRPLVRMRGGDRFRIGSVTRTFEAVVAMQLVGDGVLSLDDTVERWLPGKVPNSGAITIRELLGQRSGLQEFQISRDYLPPYLNGTRPLGYAWTPDQLLALSTALPAAFAPGSQFGYSTTNFIVLRMVIEAATGQPFPALLQQRISARLGLRSTSVDDRVGIAGTSAHGYIGERITGVKPAHRLYDVARLNFSATWGFADMASTARDLATFFRALVGGKLLRPDLLDAMLDSPSSAHYGLGTQRLVKPSPCGQLYGYDGFLIGDTAGSWVTRSGHFSVLLINRNDLAAGAPSAQTLFRAEAKAGPAVYAAACRV